MSTQDDAEQHDQSQYEAEVRERWGDQAWEQSAKRRNQMTDEQRRADDQRSVDTNVALRAAAEAREAPSSERFQGLVSEHYRWITDQWGGEAPNREAYSGLAEMYVADARFAATYGGQANAEIIREAIQLWIAENLD